MTANETRTRTVSLVAMIPGKRIACPAGCEKHSTGTHKAWTELDARRDTAATLLAATKSRCGCGYHGGWSASVSGTSGGVPCVWAGCPNCGGRAVGVPISAAEYRRWKKLDEADQARAMAMAINDAEGKGRRSVTLDMDTLASTIDYDFNAD